MKQVRILFFIKRTKKHSNGECPIYCRLTLNGQRAEFSANETIAEESWNSRIGKSEGRSRKDYRVNRTIDNIRSKIVDIETEAYRKGISISPLLLKNEFLGINKPLNFLLELYEDHNNRMKELVGKEYAPKTLARHQTSIKHVKSFINDSYKTPDIELNKITHHFLIEYEHWLKTHTDCEHNSVIKYIKNLGKIIRIARNKGYIEHDPFLNTKFKFKEVDKPFLSQDELDMLIKKKFSIKRLDKVRDVFLFCCYTGLAFIDVKELKETDIITISSEKWIYKKRQKTKNWSSIPLLPGAEKILEKYKSDDECEVLGTLLPVPSNQRMNSYLKEIADLCEIKIKLTTHVARHTFATTVTLANDVSMEAVSKMLGHSSLTMTKKYARIINSYVANQVEKIKNKY